VPEVVVDDDQVALLPAVMLALVGRGAEEAVAMTLDHVQPCLARMPVQRLRLAWSELDHHLRDARGLAADRAVDEEFGTRAARRREQVLLIVRRVDAAAASLVHFIEDAAQPSRVRIVALRTFGRRRPGR